MKRCMQHRPEGTFAGQGEWAHPEQVRMVVEVASYDTDTDKRDREEKPAPVGFALDTEPLKDWVR